MLVEITKFNKQEVTVVTSLDVAETFEKEHKNVLRDIIVNVIEICLMLIKN